MSVNSYKPGVFLWNIKDRQNSPRCDTREFGVPSGTIMFTFFCEKTHKAWLKKIFQISFVIDNLMILDLLAPPRGRGKNKGAVARPICVRNSHIKFGWISSNGLGGDSVTDGGHCNIPDAFLKKSVGIIMYIET